MIQPRIIEIEQFLKSKGHTDKTIKTYSSVIGKVLYRLGLNFTEEQLENIFTYWNLSPRTYNHHRCLMNFYTKKYLGYTLTFTKAKVESSLPTFVTIEELFILLKQISNFKHKMGISLMYFSGLRVSEVCRLRKKDIDFDNQILWVRQGKGKKDRRTILVTKLAHYVEILCNKVDDYLFPTYRGHISERSFEEVLNRARIKSGLKKEFTLHDLRHSFAINLVNKGIDIEEVRKMLGHSKLTTTQIYLQCKNQNLTAIARSV
jgi:site-specific recombinase XerD